MHYTVTTDIPSTSNAFDDSTLYEHTSNGKNHTASFIELQEQQIIVNNIIEEPNN